MIDLTTRILLEKYQPDSPLLQVEVPRSEPVDTRASLSKSVKTDDGNKTITLVMSSEEYTDKQITEAVAAYNLEHPEHKSYSYQLPTTMFGIPANSWVLALPEGEAQ